MKLFLFAVGARDRASSRLRVWDHVSWLAGEGFDVRVASQIERGVAQATLATYWRILRELPLWILSAFRSDVVLVQESLLLLPFALFRNLGRKRRLIFDFSDPIDSVGSGLKGRIRQWLFEAMVRNSDSVVVENRIYLRRLRGKCAHLSHFYGPVDASRYGEARARRGLPEASEEERPLRLGWTGSPGTFGFIRPLLPAIDRLGQSRPITLVLVGAPEEDLGLRHAAVERHAWREDTEFDIVASFDIGLFRLPPGETGLYRGAGKLFIYFAAGVVPLASARGISADLMAESGLGFPVEDDDAWDAALASLPPAVSLKAASQACMDFARRELSYEAYRQMVLLLFRPD